MYYSLVVTTHDVSLDTDHPPRRSWWDACCHADLVLLDLKFDRSHWQRQPIGVDCVEIGTACIEFDGRVALGAAEVTGCSVLTETGDSRGATMRSAACDHA